MTYNFEPFDDWFECTFDDAKSIAALMGWHIDNIYFSGFWSQGDGACFTGTLGYAKGCARAVRAYAPQDTELHRIADAWQAAQRAQFYSITGSVTHNGHYSHEHSVSFDWSDARREYGWTNDAFNEDAFEEPARDFMRWIYRRLEREYDYQRAWNMASRWSDCATEATEARASARAALRDYRALPNGTPDNVRKLAKRAIRSALETWQEALTERETIADDFSYWPGDGEPRQSIEQFAADNI